MRDAQQSVRPERPTAPLRSLLGTLVAPLLGARSTAAFGIYMEHPMIARLAGQT